MTCRLDDLTLTGRVRVHPFCESALHGLTQESMATRRYLNWSYQCVSEPSGRT
jgi:hypothetical protein